MCIFVSTIVQVSMYGYRPDAKSDRITPYTEENCEFIQITFGFVRIFLTNGVVISDAEVIP